MRVASDSEQSIPDRGPNPLLARPIGGFLDLVLHVASCRILRRRPRSRTSAHSCPSALVGRNCGRALRSVAQLGLMAAHAVHLDIAGCCLCADLFGVLVRSDAARRSVRQKATERDAHGKRERADQGPNPLLAGSVGWFLDLVLHVASAPIFRRRSGSGTSAHSCPSAAIGSHCHIALRLLDRSGVVAARAVHLDIAGCCLCVDLFWVLVRSDAERGRCHHAGC